MSGSKRTLKESECSTCHTAGAQDGKTHDVQSRHHADKKVDFDTPSLSFVSGRAPYFHDGRYATLRDVLVETDGTMGHTRHLEPGDVDALEAYHPDHSAADTDRYLALARDSGLALAAQASLPADLPAGGCYVPPTLLAPVAPGHRLAREEIFGPVQVMIPFDGEAEALAIANGTNYGLVAGVWTRDGGRQLRMARKLHCGQVFINNYGAGGGIELPFGGIKHSGHGREKGFEALYGFAALKTVAIKHD